MALEILEALDGLLIRADDHRQAGLVVRVREEHIFLALVVDRHARDDDIDVLGLHSRDQAIKADVLDLDLIAHLLADGADQVHIEALVFLLAFILELERCKVDGRTDLEHLGTRTAARRCRVAAAAASQCKRCKDAGCQKDE